jgi:23S rRNA (guanosine2251-2'-O)-methyltransferase
MTSFFWIGGKHAVIEAIKSKNRVIKEILMTETYSREINNLIKENHRQISSKIESIKKIDKLFNSDFKHQGIAAYIKPFENFILKNFFNTTEHKKSLIVILDGITDQRNIGSILRSCLAFNVDVVVVQKNYFKHNSAWMYKNASGAIEHLKICEVTNLNTIIKILKEKNFLVIGLDSNANKELTEINNYDKICIVLGSEDNGLRKLVSENCDELAKIKINKKAESLNVSNACAISLNIINQKLNF